MNPFPAACICYVGVMIIWLNGTFGAGKTTTAKALEKVWGNSRQFDPEWVGVALARNLSDAAFSDFQDLPPWRPLVVANMIAVKTHTRQNLISVQSVLNRHYWAELRQGLQDHGETVFHVLLDCEEDVLRDRIENDAVESQAREWRIDHLPTYRKEKAWLVEAADLVIDTTGLAPEEVAAVILKGLEASSYGRLSPDNALSTVDGA